MPVWQPVMCFRDVPVLCMLYVQFLKQIACNMFGGLPPHSLHTSGLSQDSATLFSIVSFLKQACYSFRHTTVISLLQPPPEVFNLFDDLILMSEGWVLHWWSCILSHDNQQAAGIFTSFCDCPVVFVVHSQYARYQILVTSCPAMCQHLRQCLCILVCRSIVYHGPVNAVQEFFENQGFMLPERMDLPSWLQEVTIASGVTVCWATALCGLH